MGLARMELYYMQALKDRIQKLKKERDAVILAHFYVDGSVQEIADYVGDSYYLSKKASESPCKTILFCVVEFMGESAKILNPEKTVIMADAEADCPMAHMVTPDDIKKVREAYDDLSVVCYINSTAQTKAYSDVCVTSSNAERIVKALPQKNIFFIPDGNLGRNLAAKIPEKNFIFHTGYCCVHQDIMAYHVQDAMKEHPNAKVLVHPECSPDVAALADYAGSTSGILEYATQSDAQEFIVCTETGIFYNLQKANPHKKFYAVKKHQVCDDMKKITLEKVELALKQGVPMELNEDLMKKAEGALKQMHQIAQ